MRKLVRQIEKLIMSEKITPIGPDQRAVIPDIVDSMSKEERADLSAMIESDWAKVAGKASVLFNVFHDLRMFGDIYLGDGKRLGVPRSKGYRKKMQNKQKID